MALAPQVGAGTYVPGGSSPAVLSGYVAARRAANKAAAATPRAPAAPARPAAGGFTQPGPLGQWSPAQIQQIIGQFTSGYGTPQTPAQIQASAQAQIDPIIAALTKSETARATNATTAIKGLADSFAAEMAGQNFGAPYQTAEQGQAAVDAALQQSLTGAGTSLASDLSNRLGVINDPTTAAAASGLASRGAAIGTTELVHGSNALSELIANAAAANEYGMKQPNIARAYAIQGADQAQAQATNNIATGTQSALDQLPQIVSALQSANATLRANKASAAASLFGNLTGQNITKASLSAGIQNANTRATGSVLAAQTRANATAAGRAAAAGKPSSSVTRTINDGYLYDGNAHRIIRGGQPVPVKGTTGASKPLTFAESKSILSQASSIATGTAVGGTDKAGTYHPPLDWTAALGELRNAGLMANPQSAKLAVATLNRIYKAHGLTYGPPLGGKQKALLDKQFPLLGGG